MSDVIEFKLNPPEDIIYMTYNDGSIRGVRGKNVSMEMMPDDGNFCFNGLYVRREELLAFVLISGLWVDVQNPEYCKTLPPLDEPYDKA